MLPQLRRSAMLTVRRAGDHPVLSTLLGLGLCLAVGCGTDPGGNGGTPTPGADNQDADNDGFTAAAGDCNDSDPAINAGASEICDGVDNDCDDATDENADADADGYLSADLCDGGD